MSPSEKAFLLGTPIISTIGFIAFMLMTVYYALSDQLSIAYAMGCITVIFGLVAYTFIKYYFAIVSHCKEPK